ncbi:capsule assembly Wzi family protein [Dyadobacter sp. CY312]|uniref:capsule assembly Wzi family protein n=1 Tax=Dyadobacter sp. CY312 TaxID=2907303 RepID=UPI001F3AAB5D|nr:capsule assembly Wzi family protein [Dyadobacter sp. CY312]MCE7041263.1 capsule assembly Wzi family protein [Dyadobacter sp. CY312]
MHKSFRKIFFLCLLINPLTGFSQFEIIQTHSKVDSSYGYVEAIGYGSSQERLPFWIHANQFGVIPKTAPSGTARIGLQKFWDLSKTTEKGADWKFGAAIETVGNTGNPAKVLLPQIHATLKYKNWELFVGRKKQWLGLADSTLGSGSYAWSGNAMPIPKIQIGTTKFVNVPLTQGWVAFNGFYSDGLFEKNRPVTSDMRFHHKALYIRLGKETSRLKLYGGANHQVQWGGKSPYHTAQSNDLPKGFKNYLSVITGAIGGEGESITHFDSTSRIGNHLGSIDLAVEIETYGTSWFIYRQFIYEDGSLFYLQALKDGLNGIRVRRKNSYGAGFEITEGVLEFLYTKDQGGNEFVIGDGKRRGIDNYFNNQQVRDGWSYYKRTIGTPFIPPTSDTEWKYPAYADNHTSNNRVLVVHLGLKGTIAQQIEWYTKLSYSNNSGAYLVPIYPAAKQFSGLIALQSHIDFLGGSTIKGSFAADMGDLYPKTYGFSLGLRKDFTF